MATHGLADHANKESPPTAKQKTFDTQIILLRFRKEGGQIPQQNLAAEGLRQAKSAVRNRIGASPLSVQPKYKEYVDITKMRHGYLIASRVLTNPFLVISYPRGVSLGDLGLKNER